MRAGDATGGVTSFPRGERRVSAARLDGEQCDTAKRALMLLSVRMLGCATQGSGIYSASHVGAMRN